MDKVVTLTIEMDGLELTRKYKLEAAELIEWDEQVKDMIKTIFDVR